MIGKNMSKHARPDRIGNLAGNFKASGRMTAGNQNNTKNRWATTNLVTYFPREKSQFDDLETLAQEYIFTGHGPDEPIIPTDGTVVTMGSCFALELRNWLIRNGKNSEYINVPEGLNNSFAVRQYLEWALTGDRSTDAYWYDNDPTSGAFRWEAKDDQQELLEHFKNTNGVVVTFGLAEVWRDKDTKNVFWRGVPAKSFNPDKHECVTSTVQENVDNMKRIYELITTHAGADTTVIFTLSPVPLNATFVGRPTMISDCVSKSILRVAIDQFFREHTPKTAYYWPSFEMVRWVGAHVDFPTLFEDNTPRHVNRGIVEIIITNFVRKFFK